MKVTDVVEILQRAGIQCELHGNGAQEIARIRPLDDAGSTDLSFVAARRERQQANNPLAASSKAACLLVPERIETSASSQIVVRDPHLAILAVAQIFHPPLKPLMGIHPTAVIDPSAKLGSDVTVGAYTVIGENVTIGENSVIHPHVVIYAGATIGRLCVIHSGAVIREHVVLGEDCLVQPGVVVGGDGFGYVPDKTLGLRRIPHIGNVELGDRVDIGANTTIDRGTLGTTKIGNGTKLDNLVMVGHNVSIGENSLLCGQAGVAGSTKLGNSVVLGGQVGVADHTTVGSGIRFAAQAGVWGTFEKPGDYAGHPAIPVTTWRRQAAEVANLRALTKRIRELEKKLGIKNSDDSENNNGE